MSDKTEVQIEREKGAVAAMTNAKSNMNDVLARVATLERVLANASSSISRLKKHVGSESQMTWYAGSAQNRGLVTEYVDEQIADIAKVLA
jgi:hypothetical protein